MRRRGDDRPIAPGARVCPALPAGNEAARRPAWQAGGRALGGAVSRHADPGSAAWGGTACRSAARGGTVSSEAALGGAALSAAGWGEVASGGAAARGASPSGAAWRGAALARAIGRAVPGVAALRAWIPVLASRLATIQISAIPVSVILALAIPGLAAVPAAAEPPRRIVSLNLCADELVLRLAPPGHVASVTFLAADPASSTVADRTAGIALNRGLAEEVVPLAPDLVIVGKYTTRAAAAMLRRLGAPVLELDMPASLDEAYAQIRAVAARLGVAEKGEAMVAEIEATLAVPPPARRRSAVILRPNGFTAGPGSLPDALMQRAGLDNLAARLATDRMGQLGLEDIVTAAPEVMVVDMNPDAPPSLARSLIQHPALLRIAAHGAVVPLPARLWSCAGPQLGEAFTRLSRAAHAAEAADAAAAVPAQVAAGSALATSATEIRTAP